MPCTLQPRSISGKKLCSSCGLPLGKGAAMIIETLHLYFHIQCFKVCIHRSSPWVQSCLVFWPHSVLSKYLLEILAAFLCEPPPTPRCLYVVQKWAWSPSLRIKLFYHTSLWDVKLEEVRHICAMCLCKNVFLLLKSVYSSRKLRKAPRRTVILLNL